ncbi:MAG: YfcE family phosphodiesterase [Treponema sp.]|nr:YfcE family phosphodiesterase [Treponema sp.]
MQIKINPAVTEETDKIKILAVSDSHGSSRTLEAILNRFGSMCSVLCFCGDGIEDLLSLLEQAEHDQELMTCIPKTIYIVRGNGDESSYRYSSEILNVPMDMSFKLCGMNVYMTHGHEYDVYYGMDYLYDASIVHSASLVLFGHTHIANVQTRYGITLLNPGSCARPRGGMPHTFAIVSLDKQSKKIDYNYYEMKAGKDRSIIFNLFNPPVGELNLLW